MRSAVPALSLLHVKPALREGVGAVPILAARPSVSREPARGALQVVSCEALLGPSIPCCRPCGSVSPEGAGPLTWWTRGHAVHVLGSVHSRAGTLHVERLCGSSSRVERIVGAASPVLHEQRLARCLREVEASSVSSERTRIPPKECVSVEILFVVKLLEKCTGPQRNAERTPSRAAEA